MIFLAGQHGQRWHWRASREGTEICFAGKGPRAPREEVRRHCLPAGVESAWLRQCHSATVTRARPGDNGEGDALVTDRRQLALTVVTADCVPVLLAGEGRVAAVHAGWRGLAGSILAATLEHFDRPATVTAWIGPAIGSCCYEVGDEVADRVSAVTASPEIVAPGPRGRPHLDLVAAARLQLERCGVREIHSVDACTRCDGRRLWSYRREGAGAGRNVAAIWRA